MATITKQTIYLDLTPGRVFPVLHVSQGDTGLEALEFKLVQNGMVFNIPAAVTDIQINGTTPLGVFSYNHASGVNWSGNTVTAAVTQTMTAEKGMVVAELVLLDSAMNSLGSLNFLLSVEPSPYTGAHVSVSDLASISASLNAAQQNFLMSKSWAVGDTGLRDGEDTNNSKYWAGVAEYEKKLAAQYGSGLKAQVDTNSARITQEVNDRSAAVSSEASTRASADSNLQSQINQIIAPSGEAPSAAEVQNARIGADGVTYDTLGNAIRGQVNDLKSALNAFSGVKDYLFNPETENRWNVWGWSGKTVVIPILYVYGHIPESKGEGKFKVRYQFKDINGQDLVGVGKIGVQGQTSAWLPKKNYSITFADKFLAKNDWLPSMKYTFKSCWNDPTWARNAVSGRLWAQCVASRPNVSYEPILDEKNDSLLDQNGDAITVPSYPLDVYPNHGTYDGFPIYIIANGKYIGLYTMLIAKDKDMFGIGQYKQYKETECVVSNEGAYSSSAGGFKQANLVVDAEEGEDVSGKSTAWTYECIPNEKPKPSDYDKGVDDDAYKEDLSKYEADNAKFRASLNTMIQSVVDSIGTDDKDTNYKKVSAQYLDYDSVVDYMIFSSLINAADDVGKNWLLVTYDGTKWFFSAYDLDTTWGNWCPDYNNPNLLWRPDEGSPSLKEWDSYNRAMHMIWTYDPQRLIDRYEYLRSTVFSEENVYKEFLSFIRKIPMNAIEADRRLFRTEPNGMDFAQIENWYRLRVKKMDKQIEDLKASIATA